MSVTEPERAESERARSPPHLVAGDKTSEAKEKHLGQERKGRKHICRPARGGMNWADVPWSLQTDNLEAERPVGEKKERGKGNSVDRSESVGEGKNHNS